MTSSSTAGDLAEGVTEVAVPIPALVYPQIQVIDENKVFSYAGSVLLILLKGLTCVSRNTVNDYLQKVDLLSAGLNYHLISVFGSQSTGKSTLLNALFGTKFDVMDESKRRQTTKGIWMSRAKQDKILVMDVEGTDGRERGEDQDFERKAALFALATSEVLIVNIWEHQVGLYQGANMGLLKTVFEVNLSLFSSPNKSLLLFVIRDHIGVTPLENLAATLTADLERIWESLIKPDPLSNSKITNFFSLQFTALPHKILQPEPFRKAVDGLGHRFDSKDHEHYVFEKSYHRNVPADGWSIYAQNVWTQIELNKDLDLPTQQVLVARFRCEEIAGLAWERFENDVKPVEGMSGLVAGLGDIMGPARQVALEIYDAQASRYTRTVYEEKRQELLAKIDAKLAHIYGHYISTLHKIAIQKFNTSVTSELGRPNYIFLDSIQAAKSETLDAFVAAATEAQVEGALLPFESELQSLTSDIEESVSRLRALEAKKLGSRITRRLTSDLDDIYPRIYKNPNEDFWDRIVLTFREVLDKNLAIYKVEKDDVVTYDLGLGGTVAEVAAEIDQIKMEAWKALYRKMKEFSKPENVLIRLREHFEERFKYDDNGVPRVWKPADDISDIYSESLKSAMRLLPLYATARLENGDTVFPDPDVVPALQRDEEIEIEKFPILLSESQMLPIRNDLKRIADSMYVDAKRSTIQSIRQVPLYFYILLLALGWNEIMAILRNPLYFALLAMVGGVVYVAYFLHLLGPIMKMGNAAFDQAVTSGKEKLREVLDVKPMDSYSRNRTSALAESGSTKADIPLDDLDENGKTTSSTKSNTSPGQFN
ncbi:RHD3/Sey1 [Lipomyces tetrasporus]|uniref:RHD3/Sey1 n=1 Tax=Lipomyces tetrasporus TaxID=54092 RepID=A0AAD7QR17_9ASCO|nr:RHD3/Sey1 [Lipomyces tetrasporus]KAJ8099869.1 RHD3/Sey1 [Lipomyces tetrasporus]